MHVAAIDWWRCPDCTSTLFHHPLTRCLALRFSARYLRDTKVRAVAEGSERPHLRPAPQATSSRKGRRALECRFSLEREPKRAISSPRARAVSAYGEGCGNSFQIRTTVLRKVRLTLCRIVPISGVLEAELSSEGWAFKISRETGRETATAAGDARRRCDPAVQRLVGAEPQLPVTGCQPTLARSSPSTRARSPSRKGFCRTGAPRSASRSPASP